MHYGRIFIFAFLILYAALIIMVLSGVGTFSLIYPQASNQASAADLEKQYQLKLNQLFAEFSQNQGELSWSAKVANLEDRLMLLRVPKEYQDLHFDLTKAILLLKQGEDQDTSQARSIMETALRSYTWLATNLSIFLVNNFQ